MPATACEIPLVYGQRDRALGDHLLDEQRGQQGRAIVASLRLAHDHALLIDVHILDT